MTGTGFCQCSLDGLVDVCASDVAQKDGLVLGIHYWQVFDVLQTLDGYAYLDPACLAIGKVIPAIGTLVDGVQGIRVIGLDDLPGPCPGQIRKVALLFSVLVAIDSIERCKG